MNHSILAPSILSADFMNLGNDIAEAYESGAEYIHFDVMDGIFVPNISFGIPVLASVRKGTKAILDVHLMIDRPERYVEKFAEAGADMITFHYEATSEVTDTINKIHASGAKAGISIKPGTPVDVLYPYLSMIDMVLIMSVEPGFGGQKFMPESLGRITAVRQEAELQLRDIDIETDGGIIIENAAGVIHAGSNILVAGSAVFRGNIRSNTAALLAKMNRQGEK